MHLRRVAAATWAAMVLGSCGGGGGAPGVTVGGMVSGLTGSGLMLTDNGSDALGVRSDGSFTFAMPVPSGGAYSVSVRTQPASPTQSCAVANGSGQAGAANITNITVSCSTNQYSIGGTVAGLTGSGLVLQDNSKDSLPVGSDGSFTFATSVASGTAYTVSVLAQPANPVQVCRLTGATGVVVAGNVTNVALACVTPMLSLLAGSMGGYGAVDGPGAVARFGYPNGIATDAAGNVYVADSGNDTIRKITAAGVVTTLAGSVGVSGSADGTGSAAQFNQASGVATDAAGNVYVADATSDSTYGGNNTIRKITPAGVVTTIAGQVGVHGSANGIGTAAQFYFPNAVATDAAGNVYVADTYNCAIRKITPAGVVTTLAGQLASCGSADGTGSAAQFDSPTGVACDAAGNVYVADSGNNTIRKVTPAGVVTTIAGQSGVAGSANGVGTAAQFNDPQGVATDAAGDIYVADTGNFTIRKITAGGSVSTFAGQIGVQGSADGTGSAAQFATVAGIATDTAANVYVTDHDTNGTATVRKITAAGVVTTLAGEAAVTGAADGNGAAASFNFPYGIAADSAGTLYVVDSLNGGVRKITPAGAVTTLVTGVPQFDVPETIAVDPAGNAYVTDSGFHYHPGQIFKVTPNGVVTAFAGQPGTCGGADGVGVAAQFCGPGEIATDSAGNIYAADYYGTAVRKITPTGVVTTLAGQFGVQGSTDGVGAAARFTSLTAMTSDGAGNIYVLDVNTIRKVTPAGAVTTLTGEYSAGSAIAADLVGDVYFGDGNLIRKITPAGLLSTVAGVQGQSSFEPGPLPGLIPSARGLVISGTSLYFTSQYGVAVIANVP
jgi:sugar lactone lactonase YvrE